MLKVWLGALVALAMALVLSGCQAPAPRSPITPASAADSTYKLEGAIASGTAWVARDLKDGSLLITARHVCMAIPVRLVDRYGDLHRVASFVLDTKADLCAVYSPEHLGRPLLPAPSDPELYDPVAYVGAPLGVFGCVESLEGPFCGVAPMFKGHYAGGNFMAISAIGGASGSAVFTSDGVVGVLTAVMRGFPELASVEPRERLVAFLASLPDTAPPSGL